MSTDRNRKLARAQEMVELLEAQLASGVGIVSMSVDGTSININREQAMKELEWWEKQVTRYSRARGRTSSIRLDTQND